MPCAVQRVVERGKRSGEPCQALALLGVFDPVDDLGGKHHLAVLVGEIHQGARAGLQALAGADQHLPDGGGPGFRLNVEALAQQEHLGLAAGVALGAQEARRHDARLVGNQQVARLQVVDDVAEDLVVQGAVGALHHQHAAAVALGCGLLGDKLFGQVVVEVVGAHVHQFLSFLLCLGGLACSLALGALGRGLCIGVGAAAVVLAVHAKLAAADGCLRVEGAEVLEHRLKLGVGGCGALQFLGDNLRVLVGAYRKGGSDALEAVLVRVARQFLQADAVAGAAAVLPVLGRAVPGPLDGLLPELGPVGALYHRDVLGPGPIEQGLQAMVVFGGGGYVGIEVGDGYVVPGFCQDARRLQRARPAAGVK